MGTQNSAQSAVASRPKLDTEQLLDRPLSEADRREYARALATPEKAASAKTESLLAFRLGGEWFALPCSVVEEVTEFQKAHSLPQRSVMLEGIVNVRGRLVVCVSLSRLLEVDSTTSNEHAVPRIIVLRCGDHHLAFPASQVLGVERYESNKVNSVPATLALAARRVTRGMITAGELTVAYLDTELLFACIMDGLS